MEIISSSLIIMNKKTFFIILLFLSVSIGFCENLQCAAELQNTPGVCIDKKYDMLSGDIAYWGCNTILHQNGRWFYYEKCKATISSMTKKTKEGNYVAEAWTNNNAPLSKCSSYNGWACDVYPGEPSGSGFDSDDSHSDRGYCDASDGNCVKCNNNNIETKKWDGGASISGSGDYKCESGCGAHPHCDELFPGNNTGSCFGVFETRCTSSCGAVSDSCESDCGAHNLCDELNPNSVCVTDYCDEHNRLVDYNGDYYLNSNTCTSTCDCDNIVDNTLCDSDDCGASTECNNKELGYNTGNSGCDTNCYWQDCGMYAWNTNNDECYTSCSLNSHCYESVCNDYTSDCVMDGENPIILINQPIDDSRNNEDIVLEFYINDSVDGELDCSYILDSTISYIGELVSGNTYQEDITCDEEWHTLSVNCSDDAGNHNLTIPVSFLYDTTPPDYSHQSWTDITPTPDNTLITGDEVRLSVYWTDNFELDNSTLQIKPEHGGWSDEEVIEHNLTSSRWSNFTLNTSSYGDELIEWRVKTLDSSGNERVSDTMSFFVNTPSAEITITIYEVGGDISDVFEFSGDAKPVVDKPADDSNSTEFIGDFTIEHVGIGTLINNSFYLNNSMSSGIIMKVSDNNDAENSVILSDSPKNAGFCNGMISGDTCQVWLWMDLDKATPPQVQNNRVMVESVSVE